MTKMTRMIPPPELAASAFDIVFLDRDGTLNSRLPRYVTTPTELELLPGAADAVAELNRSGARVVLVTNQRGVATGELSAHQLDEVHHALRERLDMMLEREGRAELAASCFDFLPTRALLDLMGWPEQDIFSHE